MSEETKSEEVISDEAVAEAIDPVTALDKKKLALPGMPLAPFFR